MWVTGHPNSCKAKLVGWPLEYKKLINVNENENDTCSWHLQRKWQFSRVDI